MGARFSYYTFFIKNACPTTASGVSMSQRRPSRLRRSGRRASNSILLKILLLCYFGRLGPFWLLWAILAVLGYFFIFLFSCFPVSLFSRLPCFHASMLPCFHASMLPCFHASMLPCFPVLDMFWTFLTMFWAIWPCFGPFWPCFGPFWPC